MAAVVGLPLNDSERERVSPSTVLTHIASSLSNNQSVWQSIYRLPVPPPIHRQQFPFLVSPPHERDGYESSCPPVDFAPTTGQVQWRKEMRKRSSLSQSPHTL